MAHMLVLHGPNLNLLGQREQTLYGAVTLDALNQQLTQQARASGHHLTCIQSNSEATLIDTIQQAPLQDTAFIIINAAGLTHTSICLRDALLAVNIPYIEVHMTNLAQREPFRQQSYLTDHACGIITGLGIHSYTAALYAADQCLQHTTSTEGATQPW